MGTNVLTLTILVTPEIPSKSNHIVDKVMRNQEYTSTSKYNFMIFLGGKSIKI